MKKEICCLLFIILISGTLNSQNLVPNPGFEQETIVFKDSTCTKYSFPHWNSLFDYEPCGIYESGFFDFRVYLKSYHQHLNNYIENWEPDFRCTEFKSNHPGRHLDEKYLCFKGKSEDGQSHAVAIDTSNRYHRAKDGYCYLRNGFSFKRELFQVELKEPLQKDSCYLFEMYYKFPRYFSSDAGLFTNGRFGASFTGTDFTDPENRDLFDRSQYSPQLLVETLDSNALTAWVRYSQVFSARGNSAFLVVGNFEPFNPVSMASPISYHIDRLRVEKCDCNRNSYIEYDTNK